MVEPIRRGSVGIVEAFYGETVSPALIALAARTPFDQLLVLAERIEMQRRRVAREIRLRRYEVHSGIPSLLGTSALGARGLTTHEDFYLNADSFFGIGESRGIKHWVAFGEQLVLPDPTFTWAAQLHEAEGYGAHVRWRSGAGTELAQCLEKIDRLLPMVDAGAAVLMPGPDAFDPHVSMIDGGEPDETPLALWLSEGLYSGFSTNLLWEDPYLAWVIVNRLGLIPEWDRRARDLDDPRDFQELACVLVDDGALERSSVDIWTAAYGVGADDPLPGIALAILNREAGLSPGPRTRMAREHLLRCTSATLEGGNSPQLPSPALRKALELELPDLSIVSMRDLLKLRANEAVFEQFRVALCGLAGAVAEADPQNSASLQRVVAEAAGDTVRPVSEQFGREIKRLQRRGTLGGLAAGASVRVIFDGIATWVAPPAAPVTRAAGPAVGRRVRRSVADRLSGSANEIRIANDILMSVESTWTNNHG